MDESPVGAYGTATVWMAGGPLDGLAYTDMPLFETGKPGVSIAIPMVRADGLEYFVKYDRRDEISDGKRWFYDFAGESESAQGNDPQPLPLASVVAPDGMTESAVPKDFSLNERFIIERAWWIASELKRRHPHLKVHEAFPMGGFYRGLEVGVDGDSYVFMNFVGSVHLTRTGHTPQGFRWRETLEADTPHDHVKRIEKEMDWALEGASTTAETLTYRVISALVTERLNDRHRWDAGNSEGVNMRAGERSESAEFLIPFRGAQEAEREKIFGLPLDRYWAIQRNGEVRAILHESGFSYHPDREPINLFARYRRRRRLRDVLDPLNQALDEF